MNSKRLRLLTLAALVVVTGCSEDDKGPTTPPDTTPPTVESITPANGATGQPVSTILTVEFSEAMDVASIDASTFQVRRGGTVVSGTVTVDDTMVSFDPTGELAGQSTFTVTLTTGVKDLAGNGLAQSFSWSFTTADVSAPTVTARSPEPNATGVSIGTNIAVTFSESIAAGSVTSNTVRLKQGSSIINASLSVSGATVTLDPTANLNSVTTYTVEVTTGVTDLAGIALGAPVVWSFVTQDAVAPTVASISPGNGATKVDIDASLVVTFSEPIQASSVTSSSFTVRADTWVDSVLQPLLAGTITVSGNTVTFKPTRGRWQEYSTGYTVALTSGIKDLAGNALSSFSSTFQSVFLDEDYLYKFHTELQGKARVLDTYANSYGAHMSLSSANTSGARWYVTATGNSWLLRNQFGGDTRYLEGGTGAGIANLAAGVFTGQIWNFVQVSGRLGVPTTPPAVNESPVSYRMRTQFQGSARSLELVFSNVNNVYEAFMDADSNYIGSWWFITNFARR